MNKLLLIARHEFVKHVRRMSFIIGTLLIPVMALSATIFLSFFAPGSSSTFPAILPAGNAETSSTETRGADESSAAEREVDRPDKTRIGYVDHANIIVQPSDIFSSTTFVPFPDEEAARAALQAKDLNVFYVMEADYLSSGTITRYARQIEFVSLDRSRFTEFLRYNLLHHRDERIAERLGDVSEFETRRLKEDGQPFRGRFADYDMSSDDASLFVLPFAFALLLYMTIFSSAGLLQNSVIEEKENRILEILLTSLQPWQLLGGKIIGLGMLGLLQMLIWIGTGLLFVTYHSGSVEFLQQINLPTYVWMLTLPYYLLGYLVYGGLMAGIGATLTTTREGSVLTSILLIPVMAPFLLLFGIIDHPDGWLAIILSLIPYTASITMMTRLTLVDVVWWQIALSLIFLVGSVILSIQFSAKLFRTTMLLKGKKLNVREVWRALRTGTEQAHRV